MNILLFIFIILSTKASFNDGAIIKSIYFDPQTSVTADKKDGIVILELENGTKSTICMTNVYDNKNAEVVCRMMKYTGGNVMAYAVVSSLTSTIGSTLFQSISCAGNEASLENCPNFIMGGNNFLCNNHNQDLHVYCNGDYVFSKVPTNIANCEAKLSNGNEGLMSVSVNGIAAYFCGVNGNFDQTAANYFCKNYLCYKSSFARILEGYKSPIRVIGGFNSMTCNNTGCINIYPSQSNKCTPDTNIAVLCTDDATTAYVAPNVTCSNSSMTVTWSNTVFGASLVNNVFSIKYNNGSNCTLVNAGTTVTQPVILAVNYGTCDMNISGDAANITFSFQVTRMYPKTNNIITNTDENFNVTCYIIRNSTVIQGPLQINPVALPPSSGKTNVDNTLRVYSDSDLTSQIPNLGAVSIGSRVFVLVTITSPPPNVILVLSRCYYDQPPVNLILNRCAARTDVQITPISAVSKSFSFVVTQTVGSQNGGLACSTTLCSTMESNCLTTC